MPVFDADTHPREQVRQHRDSLPLTVLTGVAVGTLLVAALWPSLAWRQLLPWLVVAALTMGYLSWLRLAHDGLLAGAANDGAWHRRYRVGAALRGLSWGVCCWVLWPAGDTGIQALITVAMVVVGTITLASLAFDAVAAGWFATPVLAPLAWLHSRSPEPRAVAMLVMLMVLGFAVLRVARQSMQRARYVEALRRSDTANLRAAEQAAQRLREAEQIAGMGSFDWDLVSGKVHWSDHHFRLWGLAPGSAVPDTALFFSAIHADDRARVEDELRAVQQGGRRHTHMRYRLVLADGQVRHIEDRGEVYLDSGGKVARLTGIVHDITEQVNAEESLRLVEFTMNTIADPVGVIDDRLTYRLVNKAWCDANRLTPQQVLGRTLDQVFPKPVSQARRNAVKRCVEDGTNAVVRDPSPSIATGKRILETRYFAFNEPDVSWHGAVMVSRDVTAEAEALAALEASLVNLRLTLNSTGDAILATDADARDAPVLFVNDQWLDLWRMPRVPASQVTAEFIIEHSGPFFADPDREVARIVEIIASGRPADDRLELLDGRILLRRCRIAITGQRQVRVWGFRDITAETQALQRLRDAEAQQRALLDAFPGFITANDEQLNLVYVNARFCELVGETAERLVGTNIASRLTADEAAILRAEVAQAISGRPVVAERHPPATADRPARDILVTRIGGVGIDGAPLCYSFGTDITDLNRMQRELLAAKEEAERANRAKSVFLSNMSHELRTPLNAVLGFGQVLQMNTPGNLTAKQLRQASEIMRAGKHLLALINDLLDLARVEAGRMPISLEPVDLPELLQECLELIAPVAQQADVELESVDPRLAGLVLVADRTRLKQVLLNLLSNAIKYNLRHGRVWLSLARAAPGRLRLQVCDSGPGLDDVAQARLFQPFERLNADQTPTDGSGVGLALSRRLMQLMQGEIGVESRLGEGSAFWLDLPLPDASTTAHPVVDAATPDRLPGSDPAPQQVDRQPASLRVLCIDDNPVNLVLLADMFELRPDLQLACTADPLHGLRLAKDDPPEVLLLDIQMPMVDGPEVLRRLRADPDTAGFPIVAISADAMPQVVQRCLADGFADYITKPFTAERVFGAIDSVLAGRRSAS